MGQNCYQSFKVPGHPHHEQLRVTLIDDIVNKKRLTTYHQKEKRAFWICCDDYKTFFVLIEWKAFPYCLDELHAIVQIEGVVKQSIILKKEDVVDTTVSRIVWRCIEPRSQRSRPFRVPAEALIPAEPSFEHEEVAHEVVGMISVDICTSGNEKLGTFLFQRQTKEFLRSKGIDAGRLSKKERKVQNQLNELKKSRDIIDKQIQVAEGNWDRLQSQKQARQRGPGPVAAALDDGVTPGAARVVSDQVGAPAMPNGEVATDISMGDAEVEEDAKMNDNVDHHQSSELDTTEAHF